ncbi:30S ribosomal protein S8 [Candidatus Dependentiae bacterium]|nr:30S ribosomal protein S8 [Candidatus Dependentiae bacterium]
MDSIGDFLTVIRNGISARKRTVKVATSKLKLNIASLLKDEGYVKDFKLEQDGDKSFLTVHLKYVNGEPAIHEITRMSTPGRRSYKRVNNIKPVIGGLGIAIVSTSQGLLTDRRARELSVGGELICQVW